MPQISELLADIEKGRIGLPEFQRQYVWKRRQIREFFYSLYQNYPIGSILLWRTEYAPNLVRHNDTTSSELQLIVDGQQRLSTIYGIIKGKTPDFFDGDTDFFDDLKFNVETEEFAFPRSNPQNNPLWVDVSDLFEKGSGEFQNRLSEVEINTRTIYINRLNRLFMVQNRNIAVEVIPDRFDLRTVVDIFEKVNRNGTPLNQVDLTISFMSLNTPNVRDKIGPALEGIRNNRYWFDESWLLRCLNAVVYSRSDFEALYEMPSEKFQNGLKRIKKHIRAIIEQIQAHLGLDHNHVLFGKPTLVILAKYLDKQGGLRHRKGEVARMLYWYVSAAFWGRYSGANIGTIQQDLNAIDKTDGHWKSQLEALNNNLHHQFGEMKLWKEQFLASTRRPRAFPLLYLLTRSTNARDLCSGVPVGVDIHQHVNVHHIFPQAQLRKYEEFNSIRDVHNISNFTILSQPCNLEIRDKLPEEYLPKYQARHRGVLQEHWIPEDPELWKIQNYRKFLVARSQLICDAANEFLAKLASGKLPSED